MRPVRIVVMAKVPRAGLAKSRLIPALGADGAARLARRMFDHALVNAYKAGIGTVELCRTPYADPMWDDIELPAGVTVSDQGTGDLGERMARVSRRVITAGEAVILIGTDCPRLDVDYLRNFATSLEQVDAVIGPATDGGYVALGLNRFHARVFSSIEWGGPLVSAVTLERFGTLDWTFKCMPPLQDIDRPEDLSRLPTGWLDAIHA